VDGEFRGSIAVGGGAQHNIRGYKWTDDDRITGKHYQTTKHHRTYHQPCCTVSCRVNMAEDVSENRDWSPSMSVSGMYLFRYRLVFRLILIPVKHSQAKHSPVRMLLLSPADATDIQIIQHLFYP